MKAESSFVLIFHDENVTCTAVRFSELSFNSLIWFQSSISQQPTTYQKMVHLKLWMKLLQRR